MRRFNWTTLPLTVAVAFLAFAMVGCGAKEEAPTEASSANASEPIAVAANEAPVAEAAWLTSLDEGLAKAKAEDKMVMVDFGAEW